MKEIYKTVPSFPDYKVSNKGNVISYRKQNNPKKINPYINYSGYYEISVYVGKKLYKRRVHSLMAEAFLGFKYVSHKSGVINHIDGNKLNNDLNNLEIISSRKNTTHSILENKGYIGTYDIERNKYVSYFRLRGEKIFIGRFDSKEQVTEVYNYCLKISKECNTAKELKNRIKEKFKIVKAKTGRKGKTNFSGVSFQKNRTSPWRAEIRMNKKNISLGNYPTKEQAIEIKKIADDNINLFNEAQQFRELCKNIFNNKN